MNQLRELEVRAIVPEDEEPENDPDPLMYLCNLQEWEYYGQPSEKPPLAEFAQAAADYIRDHYMQKKRAMRAMRGKK